MWCNMGELMGKWLLGGYGMAVKILYTLIRWGLAEISMTNIGQLWWRCYVMHDLCNMLCMQYDWCFSFLSFSFFLLFFPLFFSFSFSSFSLSASTNKFWHVPVIEIFPQDSTKVKRIVRLQKVSNRGYRNKTEIFCKGKKDILQKASNLTRKWLNFLLQKVEETCKRQTGYDVSSYKRHMRKPQQKDKKAHEGKCDFSC